MEVLTIRSISKSIHPVVTAPKFHASLIAVFNKSCDLDTQEGEIIAVVNPDVGNGPFHLVLSECASFADWRVGAAMHGDGSIIWVDMVEQHQITLYMEKAELWDPCPDWEGIRGGERLPENIPALKEILTSHAPEESLPGCRRAEWKEDAHRAILSITELVKQEDLEALTGAIRALCGLGPGLTPSGDDWLAGWLLGLRLGITGMENHPAGEIIFDVAKKQTTRISQAFLMAAVRGEVDETWHGLLESLAHGEMSDVRRAAIRVMKFGATSGADMLAGFMAVLS